MDYDSILGKIVEFCKTTPEKVYTPRYLIGTLALGLGVTPRGLGISLDAKREKIGLLQIYKTEGSRFRAYYGFSPTCGSRECFADWCKGWSCKTRKGNEKIQFVQYLCET